MELSKIYYKFKICVTLKEYSRALMFLESIGGYIEELTREDVELIILLKKGLLKQHGECISLLRVEQEKTNYNKFSYRKVYDDYFESVVQNSNNTFQMFLTCITNLIPKVKDKILIATMHEIKAKIILFLHDLNLENNLISLAYDNFKIAIEEIIRSKSKDYLRTKVVYSYIKFISKHLNDNFRAVLFCINFMDGLNESTGDVDKNLKEYNRLISKMKYFYENNLESYNTELKRYHHEFR